MHFEAARVFFDLQGIYGAGAGYAARMGGGK